MRNIFRTSSRGFTFVELIVATAVMMILASAAMPLVRVSMKRQREADLRYSLRQMREAIDSFKDWADNGRIAAAELQFGSEGYPATLDQLVQGVAITNDATGRKKKFLRKIPIDPMTGTDAWGLRSYQDAPDAKVWGGQSVYDVFSRSEAISLNKSKYRDW